MPFRWASPILLLLSVIVAGPALAQDFPKLTGRVVDGADLLTPADEAALTAKLEALETASSRQLVVATVPDLQGYEIEDYGYRLGRAWEIGQSEANNGTILLVAPNDRKVRIEVGYGLEPILTDALSSLIVQNAILPRFRENDYAGGINAGTDQVIAQLQAPPELAEQRALEAAAKRPQASSGDAAEVVGGAIGLGLILLIIVLPLASRKRRRRSPWGGRRYGGSHWPIILWAIADEVGRSSRGGGGFGGFGGGGGGGGFGGFSGGGGSFGGGGASGSW